MNKLNWFKDIEAEAKEILTADGIKIELYNIMQMFKTMMTRYYDDEESLREDDFYTLKLLYKTDFITMYNLEDILTQWIADKIDITLINKADKQKPKKGALKVNFDSLSAWIGFCNKVIMDYMGFSSCTEEYARVQIGKQLSTVKCSNLPYVEYIRSITLIEESKEDKLNILDLETKTVHELHKNYNKLVEPVKRVIADIGLKTSEQVTETLLLLYRKVSLIGEEVSRQAKLDTVNKILEHERKR